MSIRTVLIDDETKARKTLRLLLEQFCPETTVIGDFENTKDGEAFINSNSVDLLFLDVEMPGETGIQFLNRIGDKGIKVIMVTAHAHYAIKAIKLEAFDYILKPIDVSELQAAIEKFKKRMDSKSNAIINSESTLTIPTREGIVFVKQYDIIHIDAEGSYSTIYTNDSKMMVSQNLSELSSQLNHSLFLRVHNSHIINMSKVKTYIKTDGHFAEMANGNKITISRRKKDEFIEAMRSL
ncbi:MAG: LytTR family DNA-binding domain-containing protein [Bacteroidota bacterium]|nr:LytTR family DNA-binding domain-containing protein [Bacteroidota bacterium]